MSYQVVTMINPSKGKKKKQKLDTREVNKLVQGHIAGK